ncbi:MAG: DNA recombination protein RmuC [Clostridium sp.]|nr:DNA recombination protein RmuC [Clostridium sp.]MDY5896381.1 DNA recombination protein RmuC [Oscillospiraceae bacterium]
MEYIIAAMLAVAIVLLIVLLIKQGKAGSGKAEEKIDNLASTLGAEFERSRRESSEAQRDMRAETAKSLGEMSEKLEKLRLENTGWQGRIEKSLAESLSAMQLNNIEQNEKQSRALTEAVDKMRESNEKKLEQMRVTVDEKLTSTLSQRLDSSFKTVSDRLESVYKSLGEMKELSNGVTANVTTLNRVLTNVKARGTWAEIQLGSILDQTIPGMYETNFTCVPNSKEKVEFAVRIPSSDGEQTTYLPIDSKFPMEDYVRLCTAADSADAEALAAARKALESRVVSEARTISKYINVPLTTPFAIMYLATEGLYAEIASSRSGVPEKLRSEFNVMIAGPSTITALLNSLSLGFRAVAINEKANEVRLLLAAARVQYDKFGVVLRKARQKIDEAGKSLDEADKRNEIIRKKLGKAGELDGSSAADILGLEEDNSDT